MKPATADPELEALTCRIAEAIAAYIWAPDWDTRQDRLAQAGFGLAK